MVDPTPFPGAGIPKRRPLPFPIIYPTRWEGMPDDPVEWIVDGYIPRGSVVLFSGDSGLGKSLILQQLQAAANFGKGWLGFNVKKCRSFGLYAEDPEKILRKRQRDICQHYGGEIADLEDISYHSGVGEDCSLMDFNRRTDAGQTTPMYEQIRGHLNEFGAEIAILDTRSRVFNGSEGAKPQVLAFMGALQALADGMAGGKGGAVILTDHPSLEGLATGRGTSGSVQFRAVSRAFLYLKRPRSYDDEAPENPEADYLILQTMKNNWGGRSPPIKVKWDQGVFVRQGVQAQPGGLLWNLEIEAKIAMAFRAMMDDGMRLHADTTQHRGYLRLLKGRPGFREIADGQLTAACERMLGKGKLVRVKVKGSVLVRPPDVHYDGEPGAPEASLFDAAQRDSSEPDRTSGEDAGEPGSGPWESENPAPT